MGPLFGAALLPSATIGRRTQIVTTFCHRPTLIRRCLSEIAAPVQGLLPWGSDLALAGFWGYGPELKKMALPDPLATLRVPPLGNSSSFRPTYPSNYLIGRHRFLVDIPV